MVVLGTTMRRSRRYQKTTRSETLDEDAALTREYENTETRADLQRYPKTTIRAQTRNERKENRMLLVSEVESTLPTITKTEEGIEIEFT